MDQKLPSRQEPLLISRPREHGVTSKSSPESTGQVSSAGSLLGDLGEEALPPSSCCPVRAPPTPARARRGLLSTVLGSPVPRQPHAGHGRVSSIGQGRTGGSEVTLCGSSAHRAAGAAPWGSTDPLPAPENPSLQWGVRTQAPPRNKTLTKMTPSVLGSADAPPLLVTPGRHKPRPWGLGLGGGGAAGFPTHTHTPTAVPAAQAEPTRGVGPSPGLTRSSSQTQRTLPQTMVCMVSSGKHTCLWVEKLPSVPVLCADTQVDIRPRRTPRSLRSPLEGMNLRNPVVQSEPPPAPLRAREQ